jgi:hypothetical protein
VQSPTRAILILLVFSVVGLSALGFMAYRYSRLLEGRSVQVERATREIDTFIQVRQGMRREVDGWAGGSGDRAALVVARDRGLALCGVESGAYAATRELYRAWREGRSSGSADFDRALEGRREALDRVDLGPYESLDR